MNHVPHLHNNKKKKGREKQITYFGVYTNGGFPCLIHNQACADDLTITLIASPHFFFVVFDFVPIVRQKRRAWKLDCFLSIFDFVLRICTQLVH